MGPNLNAARGSYNFTNHGTGFAEAMNRLITGTTTARSRGLSVYGRRGNDGTAARGGPLAALAAILAAAALAVALAACGGDDPAPEPAPTQEPEAQATPAPAPPAFIGGLEAIFADDFESYAEGAFPREGRWQRWKSGALHVVASEPGVAGSKFYKLGKFAQTAKPVPVGLPGLTYTAKFMVPAVDETVASPVVLIGLGWKMADANVPHASSCGVWVGGRLVCGGTDLGLAEAGRWYEVHAVADLAAGSAQYWLDGRDLGVLPLETAFGSPRDNVSHFLVVTGPREIEAYIDDVAAFRGEVAPLNAAQP